jgi:hypothetical protein
VTGARPAVPAVVHVDLDGARHIFRVHGWPCPAGPDTLFDSGLRGILGLLETNGLKATLFVIAEDLDDPPKRALIEEAVRRGHEIGSHTLTHRWLSTLSRAEQEREIGESRRRLSESLGVEVQGFRAPGFRLGPETLDLVAAAGYAYDSSRFAGEAAGAASCRELALPGYRPLPFPFHPSYALVLGMTYFRLGLRRFRTSGAPLVLVFHLTDLAAPLGPEWLHGWHRRVFTLSYLDAETKRRRCQAMLDAVRREYAMMSTSDLLAAAPAGR